MTETHRKAALAMVEEAVNMLTRQRQVPFEKVTGKLNALRKLLIAAKQDDDV